jgi:hypothetical protein
LEPDIQPGTEVGKAIVDDRSRRAASRIVRPGPIGAIGAAILTLV